MNTGDVFALAYRTVRSNKLRTGITIAIIAIGITALIGIITAIAAMNQKLMESFSTMGSNGFTIRYKDRNIRFGRDNNSDMTVSKRGAKAEKRSNLGKRITLEEAEQFITLFHFPGSAGISAFAGNSFTVGYESRKTTPNVYAFGADDKYIDLNGLTIEAGRNFSTQEVTSGAQFCLLGYDVANKLFRGNPARAVNRTVRINGIPFRVIGVLGSRGSSFGFSRDNIVVMNYRNLRKYFGANSYTIGIKTTDINQVENAMGEAEGVFRSVRKLNTREESNFVLDRSNSIAEKAMNSLSFLTVSVTIIGLITLIGAAIGLMNIMLVSVTERTKEVGLVKAIGGKSKLVQRQFLTESVIISVAGALFGIFFGVLFGNIFSIVLETGFVVPWNWVLYGIIICTIVGLLAGIYPAIKAGRLNPIEALRYE
jgi:putative ABC transport system permease protein